MSLLVVVVGRDEGVGAHLGENKCTTTTHPALHNNKAGERNKKACRYANHKLLPHMHVSDVLCFGCEKQALLGRSWLPCFGDTTCLLGGVMTRFRAVLVWARRATLFRSEISQDLVGFSVLGKKCWVDWYSWLQ